MENFCAYILPLLTAVHFLLRIQLSKCMQFHECPERAIIDILKEAFWLLRPGGTIAMEDIAVIVSQLFVANHDNMCFFSG